ncbi:hypothetical protein SK066_19850 [Paenibacillus hunanensis]|uniref:hypothetical protein n=1 Tax=Paenibacillus hunanensis TaxID=539262 RepID=UPI002A699235|nr:hypothetical protein [Paenibacillus hunanensis]WPP40807.1 hypothetical protein SK066_19850 [Paenibacillus hunanensis]
MATKSRGPSGNNSAQNTYGLSKMLTVVAWLCCAAGILLIVLNLQPFNDNNLGLMIGVGCLAAFAFIYSLAKWLGSMQARSDEGKDGIKDD